MVTVSLSPGTIVTIDYDHLDEETKQKYGITEKTVTGSIWYLKKLNGEIHVVLRNNWNIPHPVDSIVEIDGLRKPGYFPYDE